MSTGPTDDERLPEWLDRLATEIADAVEVDWSGAESAGTDGSPLEGLRAIARIAEGYRTIGAPRTPPAFRWGPLDVYERVGEGAFGEVYRAWDPRLALEVALKLRHADDDRTGGARDLLDEARGLARVLHPNVVVVRGADVHEGRFGLWTDFVRGPSLEDHLGTEGPLPVDQVIRIGTALARATHAVHEAGYLHGDLTARNALLGVGERPVLVDFGAASPIGSDGVATGSLAGLTGTPVACAPELFFGGTPSVRSDVYALGALAFRLLTGRHIVTGESIDAIRSQLRRGRFAGVRALRDDAPAPLVRAIERATATAVEERFRSAEAFAEALETSGAPETNLPRARDAFVGRVTELEALSAVLSEGELVTLTGPGGSGKTRLACEIAARRLEGYPDGVWFVDLASASADRVASLVADVIGVRARPTETLDAAIAERLASRRALIVLDNCEHVLEAVSGLVDAVLERPTSVAVLATSRERLGVGGEHVVAVGPLPVPPGSAVDEEAFSLRDVAGTALFLERARAADATFTPDAGAARAVVEICRRLDGLPLAIELAAAQVRTMGVAELAHRMGQQLDLLVSRRRGGTERHRTLRDLMQWSHASLDGRERELFATLSLFRGGWTLRHAQAAMAEDVSEHEILAAHAALVERSLVVLAGTDAAETRYRYLEPVREYAAERLGDTHAARRRVVAFMLEELWGDGVTPANARTEPYRALLAREMANALAAFDAAMALDDVESAATLAQALAVEWTLRGAYADAVARYEALWARRAEIPSPDQRAGIWLSACNAYNDMDRYDDAERFVDAILEEVTRGASQNYRVIATSQRGNVAMGRGDFDRCEACYAEARDESAALGLTQQRASASGNLGIMKRWRGELDEAWQLFTESEALYRELELWDYVAHCRVHLAETAFFRGDQDEARRLATDATRQLRVQGSFFNLVGGLTLLARIAFADDHLESAEAYGLEALAIARRAGLPCKYVRYALSQIAVWRGDHDLGAELAVDALAESHHKPGDVRSALLHLAPAEGSRGRYAALAWMLGCTESLRHPRSGNQDPGNLRVSELLDTLRARAQAALGSDVFEAKVAEGASLTYQEAAERVLTTYRPER